jgi:single-strand DNA-binding protein
MARAGSGSGREPRNEVQLTGRLAAPAVDTRMPSGDVLTTWRLVVDRGPSKRPLPEGVRPTTVDALDCVAWVPTVQRAAASWSAGDVVAVEGALRRRFWRGGTGGTSRCEIEVVKAKRVAKAA